MGYQWVRALCCSNRCVWWSGGWNASVNKSNQLSKPPDAGTHPLTVCVDTWIPCFAQSAAAFLRAFRPNVTCQISPCRMEKLRLWSSWLPTCPLTKPGHRQRGVVRPSITPGNSCTKCEHAGAPIGPEQPDANDDDVRVLSSGNNALLQRVSPTPCSDHGRALPVQ